MLKNKHIILGISGGIAAYKSAQLLRLFIKAGAEVQVVITPNGKEFITPVTLSALSGKPVICDFFSANTGEWHSHVDLGLWADAMVIAPATASTIGKMANGIADNMLITTYLSAKCPVFIAPAMDLDMWAHPTTQRNIEYLKNDKVQVIEPSAGFLASGLIGKGRMQDPELILDVIDNYFNKSCKLANRKILITAGPTYENIDPVRFIGNYSSGKMGFALASRCAEQGAEVWLISGYTGQLTPHGAVHRIDVTSANEMNKLCLELFPEMDAAIMCAAVADYRPEKCSEQKIKRENKDSLIIKLVKNPDIAENLGMLKRPNQMLIGFALESENELSNACAKIGKKNLDWIVLNSIADPLAGFGKDTNRVTLISASQTVIPLPAKSKLDIAADILDIVFNNDKIN